MNEIVAGYDYGSLHEGTAALVMERTIEIKGLVQRCAQDVILIGQKLLEIKHLLGHGNFTRWLKTEFPLTPRTAEKWMRVAEVFKSEDFSDLNIGVSALELIAAQSTPPEAKKEVLARFGADDGIKYAEVKEIVDKHRDIESKSNGVEGVYKSIQDLLEDGRIGMPYAVKIMGLLIGTDSRTQLLVQLWGLSDPDLVPELDRLNKRGRETFEVILRTGAIPSPRGSIPINQAKLRDLSDYLNQASFEHAMAGIEVKKERGRVALQKKIELLRGDSTDVIVTEELNDLAAAPAECVVFFIPGDQSSGTLGPLIEKWGFHHLTVLLYKGDPVVNLDGTLMPARKACHRIPRPAQLLLEEFCNMTQFNSAHED